MRRILFPFISILIMVYLSSCELLEDNNGSNSCVSLWSMNSNQQHSVAVWFKTAFTYSGGLLLSEVIQALLRRPEVLCSKRSVFPPVPVHMFSLTHPADLPYSRL